MREMLNKFFADKKLQIIIIAIVTFLVYANSLPNKFLWDDHLFIESWPAIRSFENIGKIFEGDAPEAQGKIYRPGRGVIYMINWQMFGMNPIGYRVQAVLLHISVTVLIYLITKLISADFVRISADRKSKLGSYVAWLPFIVALIFGVHPIHTETIDYISASLETFGSLFFFGSFLLYVYANGERMSKRMYANERMMMRIGSVALAGLAFFTYEMTVTLPLLLVLTELTVNGSSLMVNRVRIHELLTINYKRILPYFAAAAAFVVIRTMILGLVSRTDYLGYSFYLTMVTMVKVFVRYIGLMILPVNQTAVHNLVGEFPSSMIPYDKLDPILGQTIFDLPVILSIVTIAVLILVAVKVVKIYPIITFGILWFFISLLPVSYIIPHGGAMAEKYLYIASFGFILGTVWGFSFIYSRFGNMARQGILYVSVLLIIFYAASTIARNRIWYDDISLFSDVVKKSPNNLLANYTLGIRYANAGNFDSSIPHYLRAIEKAPEFWEANYNLANVYLRQKKFEMATEQYKTILNIYPNHQAAKNILNNMDLLKLSEVDKQTAGDLVVNYGTTNGLKFSFPAYWSIDSSTSSRKIILKDADETFNVELEVVRKNNRSNEEFLKGQKDSLGQLVNQGLAQVPNVKEAFVKVWTSSNSNDQTPNSNNKESAEATASANKGQVVKLQFYLFFEGDEVVKVLVWPADSPLMRIFDGILGSIRISQ